MVFFYWIILNCKTFKRAFTLLRTLTPLRNGIEVYGAQNEAYKMSRAKKFIITLILNELRGL